MGLREKLKSLGLDEDKIDEIIGDVKQNTDYIVQDRLAQFKKNNNPDDKDNQLKTDLQKQMEENENLKSLAKGNEDAMKTLEERNKKLADELKLIEEKQQKEFSKQLDDIKLENEKLEAKNKKIYGDYKSATLRQHALEIAQEMNLKNPEFASKWLVTNGMIDLDEKLDEQGNLVGYDLKTPEITYKDKDLEKEIKKSFVGADKVKEAMSIVHENNNEFKTLFPVMANVPNGTGFNGSGAGKEKDFNDLSTDEIIQRANEFSQGDSG